MASKNYYAVSNATWLRPFLSHKSFSLGVHWVFQGMLIMDPTERRFKLGLDLILALLIGGILNLKLPVFPSALAAALLAHTVNCVLNGQVWVVLKHFGDVRHTADEFNSEVERLRMRISHEPYIIYAAAYGSLARGEWSPTSDLDVRLVRTPGVRSAWRVCLLALDERARAFWRGFPLDMFVLDGYGALADMSESTPVILKGSGQAKDDWSDR